MKNLLLILCFMGLAEPVFSANSDVVNMAYVEVNSNNLDNVGCYVRSDNAKPFFQLASVFAANINGADPNKPVIYFNSQVDQLLNHTDQVEKLQYQNIKVLLTLLGNHQNAGWACMTDQNAIQKFANQIVDVINHYHLDGVDIDDEYSSCEPNPTSMIRISQAIKSNPNFKGKLLTKALYADFAYFEASYKGKKLADFLDSGAEMTYDYDDFSARLTPYLGYGMSKNNLMLGLNSNHSYPDPVSAANFVTENNYRGVMVYDITQYSQNYLSQLANAEYKVNIKILPNCLH